MESAFTAKLFYRRPPLSFTLKCKFLISFLKWHPRLSNPIISTFAVQPFLFFKTGGGNNAWKKKEERKRKKILIFKILNLMYIWRDNKRGGRLKFYIGSLICGYDLQWENLFLMRSANDYLFPPPVKYL